MSDLSARRAPAIASTDWLRPLPPATRLAFYGAAEARALATAAWETGFSAEPLRAVHTGAVQTSERSALWLGPDEYLLLAPTTDDPVELTQRLDSAIGIVPHAVVDVSHRQTAFEIHGPRAETLLAGACPLDLDLAEFPVDMCTRTVFAKADIVLWRRGATLFHIEVWRSFSDYVTGLLAVIAQDAI
jgi:sarcosine oxidase subunit gamma